MSTIIVCSTPASPPIRKRPCGSASTRAPSIESVAPNTGTPCVSTSRPVSCASRSRSTSSTVMPARSLRLGPSLPHPLAYQRKVAAPGRRTTSSVSATSAGTTNTPSASARSTIVVARLFLAVRLVAWTRTPSTASAPCSRTRTPNLRSLSSRSRVVTAVATGVGTAVVTAVATAVAMAVGTAVVTGDVTGRVAAPTTRTPGGGGPGAHAPSATDTRAQTARARMNPTTAPPDEAEEAQPRAARASTAPGNQSSRTVAESPRSSTSSARGARRQRL